MIFNKAKLYGTTGGGGTNSYGTVFSLSPRRGAEKVMHSFGNGDDGNTPVAGLLRVDSTYYGTTAWGGAAGCAPPGCGTVFSINPKTGKERSLYSFCAQEQCADGEEPEATLVYLDGLLYSTTSFGGSGNCENGCGTVFSVDPKIGTETVVYSFCSSANCADGWRPWAGLLNVKGTLYGTTALGGTSNSGVVFSLNPRTGSETVIHSFKNDGKDGVYPYAGLIRVKGAIYGTTSQGGMSANCEGGCGTVFSIDLKTGAETVVHSFNDELGDAEPITGLISVEGLLYGTTQGGTGTVYSLAPETASYNVLYVFCSKLNCTDGGYPRAGLLDVNGVLYGTTSQGGTGTNCYGGCGTVFAIQP